MDKVRPHSTLPTRKIITKRTHSGVRRTKPFQIGERLEEKYIVHRSCQSPQIYENAAVLKASAFTQRYELVEMDEVVLRAADLVATDPDAFAKMLPLGGRL